MLSAHDTVAQKNFDPVLPPLPEEVDNDLKEESVKIVRLVKNKEPLVRNMSQLSSLIQLNCHKMSVISLFMSYLQIYVSNHKKLLTPS